MSTDPLARRYIENFSSALGKLPEDERRELITEIESHIAEAAADGQPVSDVLAKLGPADRLAMAYRAELLTTGRRSGWRPWLIRSVALGALLLGMSIPSMIIIPLLAGLGAGFVAGGVAMFAWSLCPFDTHTLYSLPGGLDRLARGATGIGFIAAGTLALAALWGYVRLLAAAVRRVARV
jgi:uncharacterized membrane protein